MISRNYDNKLKKKKSLVSADVQTENESFKLPFPISKVEVMLLALSKQYCEDEEEYLQTLQTINFW